MWIGYVVTDVWWEFHVNNTFRNVFTLKTGQVFSTYQHLLYKAPNHSGRLAGGRADTLDTKVNQELVDFCLNTYCRWNDCGSACSHGRVWIMSLGISILTVPAVGILGISPLKFNINIDLTSKRSSFFPFFLPCAASIALCHISYCCLSQWGTYRWN